MTVALTFVILKTYELYTCHMGTPLNTFVYDYYFLCPIPYHDLHSLVFINNYSLNSVDLDGLGSSEQKSQLLSDHRRLEKAAANITHTPQVLAGMYYVPAYVYIIYQIICLSLFRGDTVLVRGIY